jgi:hypothetical protein
LVVNDAQGAQVVAVAGALRNTDVELQAELAGHQGVGQGSRVRLCVLDDPRLILMNGGRAQAWFPVDVADFNAMVRLNQMRSWSTTLTIAIRTEKSRAATAGILLKAPSSGVSRIWWR